MPFIHHPYVQFVSFLLIGCAWAAMLAMPFTFVTNALQGYGHMGAYLGLFNGTICVPQIIASLFGGLLLSLVGSNQTDMMFVAAVCLILGALSVLKIKEKVIKQRMGKGEKVFKNKVFSSCLSVVCVVGWQ